MNGQEDHVIFSKGELDSLKDSINETMQSLSKSAESAMLKKMEKMFKKHSAFNQNEEFLKRMEEIAVNMEKNCIERCRLEQEKRIEKMEAKMEEMKLEHQREKEKMKEDFEELKRDMMTTAACEQKVLDVKALVGENRKNLSEMMVTVGCLIAEIKANDKEMDKRLMEVKMEQQNVVKSLETLKVDPVPAAAFKCYHCNSILSESLKLRHDGVSVSCPCGYACIYGKLEEGHKWVHIVKPENPHGWCQHFHQVPVSTSFGAILKCNLCNTEGPCKDASDSVVLPMTAAELMKAKLNEKLDELKKMVETSENRLTQIVKKVDKGDYSLQESAAQCNLM